MAGSLKWFTSEHFWEKSGITNREMFKFDRLAFQYTIFSLVQHLKRGKALGGEVALHGQRQRLQR